MKNYMMFYTIMRLHKGGLSKEGEWFLDFPPQCEKITTDSDTEAKRIVEKRMEEICPSDKSDVCKFHECVLFEQNTVLV